MELVGLGTAQLNVLFSLGLREQEVVVLFLFIQLVLMQIRDDVRLTHVDEHVVLDDHGSDRLREDTIADAEVFDKEAVSLFLVADLELSSGVLLFVLLFANGNDEVVNDFLVYLGVRALYWAASRTVQLVLYSLLAAEKCCAVVSLTERLMAH